MVTGVALLQSMKLRHVLLSRDCGFSSLLGSY